MDYEFEKSLNRLRELYETDKSILKKINMIINEKDGDKSFSKIISEIPLDIFLLIVIIISIVLVGFFSISSYGLYLFGVAFFLAGLFVGIFLDGFGLIFLFSHGITGLCIMIWALASSIFTNPVLSDGPLHLSIILCGFIVIALFVIATLLVVISNLSMTMKSKKYVKDLILFLYFLGFLITGLFVHFFPIIY